MGCDDAMSNAISYAQTLEDRKLWIDTKGEALRALFPGTGIDSYLERDYRVINIHGEHVRLRFADMPKLAEILGTEHLDFRMQAGDEMIDSVPYGGGVVLTIIAKGGP